MEAVPPQYGGGERPTLEGHMYTRAEKKAWKKRFCKMYKERIEAYKKIPDSGTQPAETYMLTPNHYVQAVTTKVGLKKRKHGFMLSDFTTTVYFSGMADPLAQKPANLVAAEHKITAQWLQVLGKNIGALQSKKKWWIKTDTEIELPEEELDEDFRKNLVKYKLARGANVNKDKETEKETEAAIARVFVNVAAERASVRMFSKQEKEEEFRRLQAQMDKMKQAQEHEQKIEDAEEHKEREDYEEEDGEMGVHVPTQNETAKIEKLKIDKEAEDNLSKLLEHRVERVKAEAEREKIEKEERAKEAEEERRKLEAQQLEESQQIKNEESQTAGKAKAGNNNEVSAMHDLLERLRLAEEELERAKQEEEMALEKLKVAEELAKKAEEDRLKEARRISVNPLSFDLEEEEKKLQEEFDTKRSSIISLKRSITPKKPKKRVAQKKPGGLLASRLAMWQQKVDTHLEAQENNVFSGGYKGESRLKKGDEGYGKPKEGSETHRRAQEATKWVEKEIEKMVGVIKDIGEYDEQRGGHTVTFGKLFKAYQDISDTLVGILMRAKKRKRVYYIGDMLYQGASDDVRITVIEEDQEEEI